MKLSPLESKDPNAEVFSKVELIVTCSARYPDSPPLLELQNPRNVPDKDLDKLKCELETIARERVGEVMVLDLAERVRDFLHEFNRPPPKSFHQQMLDKQLRMERERIQHEREMEEQERRRREQEVRVFICSNMKIMIV